MNQMPVCFYTVITLKNFAAAQVLMDSVSRFFKNADFFICVADRIDGRLEGKLREGVLDVEDIGVPREFCLRYEPFELCCALKPWYAEEMFRRPKGYEFVIYCDADTKVFAPINMEAEEWLDGSIFLSPHHFTPARTQLQIAEERRARKSGIFNAGFFVLRRSSQSNDFLRWWKLHLEDGCVVDYKRGFFVDQVWLDHVPSLFSEARIIRDPGINVAYWNLDERQLHTTASGEYRVAGARPLKLFHFSGFNPEQPELLSLHFQPYADRSLDTWPLLAKEYAGEVLRRREVFHFKTDSLLKEERERLGRERFHQFGPIAKVRHYVKDGLKRIVEKLEIAVERL